MKILLVSNYQPPHIGGIEFAARALKRCWEEDGHNVTWLASDIPRGAVPAQPDMVRIPAWNVLENTVQINAPIPSPFARSKIARLVAEHDVINVHSLAPGVTALALRAAIHQRKPIVVTQHVGIIPLNIPGLTGLQHRLIARAARRVTDYGAMLTFVGRAVRQWFLERAGIPEDQTAMTPAGVDPALYHFADEAERRDFRTKWDLEEDRFHILFVGRFCDKKELPLIEQVARATPDIHYTLVGSGPIRPERWGLPNVTVYAYVEDHELRELYGAHDLFIMPSYGEGWPAVVPQAMCCGLACLISEDTFAGYAKDPDKFLIVPRTVDAIRQKIASAAAGGESLIHDRKSLSDYATSTWNWQATAHIYLELFERAMQGQHLIPATISENLYQ